MNLKEIDSYRSSASQPRPQLVQPDGTHLRIGVTLFFFMAAVLAALGDQIEHKEVLAPAREITFWATAADKVSFATLLKGYRSSITDALEVAVRKQTDWILLWKRHTAVEGIQPALPVIDFQNEIVAAVFLGPRTTEVSTSKSSGRNSATTNSPSLIEKSIQDPAQLPYKQSAFSHGASCRYERTHGRF